MGEKGGRPEFFLWPEWGWPQTQKCVTGDGLKFLYVQHV